MIDVVIRRDDLMPVLLAAVPSFSEQWSEIKDDRDEYVKELATIGCLEGIHIACSHTTDVRQEEFEPYLGPQSRPWWRGLNAFWSGAIPRVQALDED